MSRLLERLERRLYGDPRAPFARIRVGGVNHEVDAAQFARRMGAYAAAWQAAGVGVGDIVFIILRHGVDPMPAFLAAMWIGAVPSFLPPPSARQDPTLYRRSHTEVIARTGARALLAEPDLADAFRDLLGQGADAAVIAPPPPQATGSLPAPAGVGEDAVALLQHSSGTTGLKKGVVLSHHAVLAQVDAYATTLALDGRACIATWLPLYHDMGLVACFLLPSLLGIPIVAVDPFEWVTRPSLLLEAIEAHRATHVWLPNFAFAHIERAVPAGARYDLSSLVMLIGCSEPNRPETFDRFLARFSECGLRPCAMQTCYAMAETVFAISQSRAGAPPRRLGVDGRVLLSNGPLLSGVRVAVLADGALWHEERRVGEICVSTPFDFLGYRGEATPTPPDGFHRTGDLGFIDQGEVFVLGRTKDVIIVNGRNLYAHDVEAAVNAVAGIHPGRCIAVGVPSDRTGSEEIAVIAEVGAGAEGAQPTLVAAVNRAVVASFGIPAMTVRLVPHGWLVKTTSGKLDRQENLRKHLAASRSPAPPP